MPADHLWDSVDSLVAAMAGQEYIADRSLAIAVFLSK